MTASPPQATPAPPLVLPLLSAANFVIGMGAFVVIGILNPMAADLRLSPSQAGYLMVVYALSYAVLSPVLVSLTGGIGRRRVLAGAMALFALAAAISALAPGPGTLFAARVLAAMGAGLTTPVAAAVAAGLSPPGRQGTALANVFLGFSLSQVLGVPLGSYVAYAHGWRLAFAIVALLALPVAALIWFRVPAGLQFRPASLATLGRVLRNRPFLLALSFTSLFLSGSYTVFTYIAPLLDQRMGYGRDGITLALALAGLGAVVGSWFGGRLADRIGPTRTLALVALTQLALQPIFSVLPLPGPMVPALMVVWTLFGWGFMAPQQLRLIGFASEDAGVVLALNAAAIYVGAAIGSAAGSAVLARLGIDALGWAGAGFVALALAALILSERHRPGQRSRAAPAR